MINELFRIARDNRVAVEYTRLPLNGSISVQDDAGDYVLMDYSLIWSGASELVHLAHELGHCVTGSFYNVYSPYDVRGRHERRADVWAIKKLVPKDELRRACAEIDFDEADVAERFDVTVDFLRKAIWYYREEAAV